MLTILKTYDENIINEYCARSGIDGSKDVKAFEAKNSGRLCGYILYSYIKGKCRISAVECFDDEPLFDGLIRSVFFASTECGADLPAEFSQAVDKKLLYKYGFINDDTYSVKSMSDFLNNCKNCEN